MLILSKISRGLVSCVGGFACGLRLKINGYFEKKCNKKIFNDTFLYSTIVLFILKSSSFDVQSYAANLAINAIPDVQQSDLVSSQEIVEEVVEESKNVVTLFLDGRPLLSADESELNLVLEELKKQYTFDDSCEANFVEDIRIEKSDSGIVPEVYENLRKKVLFGVAKEINYEVKDNETISDLAEKFGVTEEEIIISNGLDSNDLEAGQKINVKLNQKILNVIIVKTVSENEEIPFSTKKIFDKNLVEGTQKVKQAGVKGEKVITKKMTYVNGIEKETEILSTKVLKKPFDEEIVIGTKKAVPTQKEILADLAWPVAYTGNLTSGFGMRGKQMHYGIDISSGGIKGQPITAAYDGVVEYAGFDSSGYGEHVVIDHGCGVKTLYGHCEHELKVKKGDKVLKNQDIASVGTTGDSTGYHLHLELIIDGKKVDFSDYCKKA